MAGSLPVLPMEGGREGESEAMRAAHSSTMKQHKVRDLICHESVNIHEIECIFACDDHWSKVPGESLHLQKCQRCWNGII